MRVLYFHQYFCTPEGNSGIRSYGIAKHLVDNGHNVTMVFAESPRLRSPITEPFQNGFRRGNFEGIDLIEFNIKYNNKLSIFKRALIFIRFSIKCIKLVFTEEFDLVYATSTPLTAGIPGIIMKMMGKKKTFVFEVRDLWPELPKVMGVVKNKFVLGAMSLLEYLSYNKADACVALSPGIANGIKKRLKKDKPIYLIPNSCDLNLFKPNKNFKKNIQGIASTDFVAIFTGAHGFANGLDAVLDAAKILKKNPEQQHIKFVFIGDGVVKNSLVERAKKEELTNCIFLGLMPKKELVMHLESADVGLMILANFPAFYYGTSPNKFFDYISMGLPILNNYPGWIAEMINQNNLGIAINPDKPQEFVDALISLSNRPDDLIQMGINARKMAEEKFDRSKLAESLRIALEKVHNEYNNNIK